MTRAPIERKRSRLRSARSTATGRPFVWVFDLDNTLHDAALHVFPHLHRSMNAYLAEHLGLDWDAASALRRRYWLRYGATLLGLIRHHDVDPRHFLRVTHSFPDLAAMLSREPILAATLKRLPGRKVVFSNSPLHYAEEVLRLLGIRHLFDGVFAIEHTGWRPKPDSRGFRRLFRRHGIDPRRAIMVEDSLENLRAAKKLGMKTVWMGRLPAPRFVDVTVNELRELPRFLGRLA